MANRNRRIVAGWNQIKAVMGWDIGDGDSVAFIRRIAEGDDELRPLYLHKNRYDQVEKSLVTRNSNGMIIIGTDVKEQEKFAINFKRAPGNWDHKYVMGLTYRQHMFNYIRGVSEAILQNSANRDVLGKINIITKDDRGTMHWKKDEVLLVVGCPASVIWKGEKKRKQYEELIVEATGISNVIVTEESRAAVFSLFGIDEICKKIDLQAGVLVLDFGSSTADATYILPGEKAVNISWELGAAQVENAMLEYILQSDRAKEEFAKHKENCDKERLFAAREDCSHAILQLRENKEAYFDGKLGEHAMAKTVSIPVIDEDGDRVLFDKEGKPAYPPSIIYQVTKEMMRYALEEYQFDVRKDGVCVNHGSWKENCRQFLKDVKLTLEREKVPLQMVVVTGGGSQMRFVVDLSGEAFPGKVVPSDTPSHSVVKGLVTIAYNEVKAPEVHKKAMNDIKSDAKANIDKMLAGIAANLADGAYDAAVSAVNRLTRYVGKDDELWEKIVRNVHPETNVGEITRVINDAISRYLKKNVGRQIANSVGIWVNEDNMAIVTRINEASQQLYADRVISGMIRLSQADVKTIRQKVVLPNITMPKVAQDANFIGAIMGYILSAVLFVVLTVLAVILPVIGPGFVGITSLIGGSFLIDMMKKWESCPVTGGAILSAARKMEESKKEKMKEIEEPLNEALREAFTKPEAYGKDFQKHYTELMETAKTAFDRILLEAEDD